MQTSFGMPVASVTCTRQRAVVNHPGVPQEAKAHEEGLKGVPALHLSEQNEVSVSNNKNHGDSLATTESEASREASIKWGGPALRGEVARLWRSDLAQAKGGAIPSGVPYLKCVRCKARERDPGQLPTWEAEPFTHAAPDHLTACPLTKKIRDRPTLTPSPLGRPWKTGNTPAGTGKRTGGGLQERAEAGGSGL